eukprot:4063-Heterococcus_DN1.PRE.1
MLGPHAQHSNALTTHTQQQQQQGASRQPSVSTTAAAVLRPLDDDAAELAQLLGTSRKSVYSTAAPRKATLRDSLTSASSYSSGFVANKSKASANSSNSKQRASASSRPSTSETFDRNAIPTAVAQQSMKRSTVVCVHTASLLRACCARPRRQLLPLLAAVLVEADAYASNRKPAALGSSQPYCATLCSSDTHYCT